MTTTGRARDETEHVVVLVPGDLDDAGHERDLALALAAAGLRVTLLGVGGGRRRETWLGDVAVVRVVVPSVLRDAAARRGRVRLPRGWRTELPELDDLELALGPVLDSLAPDAVHTCDVRASVVVARAVGRAALRRRGVRWIHERARRHAAPPIEDALPRRAHRALERRYVRHADLVIDGEGSAALQDAYPGGRFATDDTASTGSDRARPRESTTPPFRRPASLPTLVGIGPANMAGQAWAWAKALERCSSSAIATEVLMVDRGSPLVFPSDELVPSAVFARDVAWQEQTRERVLGSWTHALLEAGRPIMGTLHGTNFVGDAALMAEVGITVALVFHGSEVRDPRRHAAASPWSPFLDPADEWVASVQATVDGLRPHVAAFQGQRLVSTPDLLEDLPGAVWLPVVVDCETWTPGPVPMGRRVPVVVHAPSRAAIKGTAYVDAALTPLVRSGLVEYRRLEGVAPDQMPAAVADADIVLDQFAIGSYGVLACQAMAAGRVVVGHVTPGVREHVLEATGQHLPVVEATPPDLGVVLRGLVEDREAARAAATAGASFAVSVHGGELSSAVLARTLQLP